MLSLYGLLSCTRSGKTALPHHLPYVVAQGGLIRAALHMCFSGL